MDVTNVAELETIELRSGASDEVVWTGGFFAYGGKDAEQSATIYFAVPPGDRLGKHVDTAEETQLVLSGEGEHWDVDTWPPDGSKVTGSPNRA